MLCMFILITYLIFRILKKNSFDCVHRYIILLINFKNERAILMKFLIHRRIMLIIFKKAHILI